MAECCAVSEICESNRPSGKKKNNKDSTEIRKTIKDSNVLESFNNNNNRRAKIEKDGTSPLCRMCKQADETVSHIVSECSKMAQSEYKGRHDKMATAVHWGLAKNMALNIVSSGTSRGLKKSVRMTK